ncbi:hypothetical protein [Xanthomonas translucens]|uniref:hypothetical protein n=1 Tax=Xanthomonas campestris pv. translucens TaxID=343 RepID=UPI0012D8E8E9|nr:hypothetical protein [Xanthomonas translucens]
MNEPDLGPGSFTAETSLWQIYKSARRIPSSRFNVYTTLVVAVLVGGASFFSDLGSNATIKAARELATLGLNTTLTVLGFLVAGFTIFATVTNPNMLIAMGQTRHEISGLSWLKHSFFVLIRTFIYFICYAVFCFSIVYLASPGGIASLLIRLSPHVGEYTLCCAKVAYVALATGQFFLLMQLKSFIFNMYHSVVASLQWRAEGRD